MYQSNTAIIIKAITKSITAKSLVGRFGRFTATIIKMRNSNAVILCCFFNVYLIG